MLFGGGGCLFRQRGPTLRFAVSVQPRRAHASSGAGTPAEEVGSAKAWSRWGTNRYSCSPHVSDESKRRGEDFKLRAADVVINTFPKTGTTWTQQICEQLRTGGDMNFVEITERQPWFEHAWDCGQDLDADQVAEPRLFKSHQLMSAVNVGAKYLSVIRRPEDALQSWFVFCKNKGRPLFMPCKDMNDYAKLGHFDSNQIFGTNIWEYYVELWEVRHEPNVLILCYEEMIKDARQFLPGIADFLSVPGSPQLWDTVARMSSKEFMLEHSDKFDENFLNTNGSKLGRAKMIMETGVKITSGHKAVITTETREWLDRNWKEKVTDNTGLASYEDMVAEFMGIFEARCKQ